MPEDYTVDRLRAVIRKYANVKTTIKCFAAEPQIWQSKGFVYIDCMQGQIRPQT